MSEIRKAKYCPLCGTMARLETPVCATCGHVFQTGLPTLDAASVSEDEFNKTQLFMMSPVLMQRPETPVEPLPVGEEAATAQRVLRVKWPWVAMAAGLLALLGLIAWGGRAMLAPREMHPAAVAGRWARATDRGTVGLMFAKDGSGALFWQPAVGVSAAGGGSVPLHWNQTPEGTLRLSSAPPVVGGLEVQQSMALLASQPWPWNVDKKTLTLGRLTFVRQ